VRFRSDLVPTWPCEFASGVGLSAWFVLVVILGTTRALYYEHGLGPPGLGMAVVRPIVILCGMVAGQKSLNQTFGGVPLWLLAGVHVVRILGVSFLILYSTGASARAFCSGCWLGRHFCRRNRAGGGVVCLPVDGKRSADSMALE
jgi:hypothetical protein